mmetsp:Transcript_38264/g.53123  ORF Transcript_38264/g.53123 Transcript_38264/m.53123 type:complete len:252 (+) Transcript_38264:62-817(+)|eukprot:CAMPEP_0196580248 /NCGR_PEP_ID=MMETSP1081-20130531/28058_1 /TAXON_ID=36882 /ORGANISM="Pyramimonas amylifera, Strain CCMP720" /LENGTH=251 /DNA_ID=CAMNT_0041900075 /DNA_START=56 /DNA_END=811 /DNA_ORIENTATION=-
MARQISSAILSNIVRSSLRNYVKPNSFSTICGISTLSCTRTLPIFVSQCATISRGFTSSGLRADVAAKNLTQVFSEELSGEKETYEVSPDLKEGPPVPFKLIETENSCELVLTRDYESEKISVSFLANDANNEFQEEEEEEAEAEDEYPATSVFFTVDITKGNDANLTVHCSTDGKEVMVREVMLESDSEDAYAGPEWSLMDKTVLEAMDKYLQVRGVNEDLCGYIMEAVQDKEQREYMAWLQKVQDFLKK